MLEIIGCFAIYFYSFGIFYRNNRYSFWISIYSFELLSIFYILLTIQLKAVLIVITMSNLARRPLHGNEPGALSQSKDDVDQDHSYNRQPVQSYEEGTSSADELEESESHDEPSIPKPTDQSRRRSISTSRPSSRQEQHNSINEHHNGIGIKLALAGVLFGLMVVYGYGSSIIEEKQCDFKDLRTKYPQQQEKVWRALQKGIEGLINKKDKHPSVFLFLHQDPKLQKLIDEIAIEASMCFGKKSAIFI